MSHRVGGMVEVGSGTERPRGALRWYHAYDVWGGLTVFALVQYAQVGQSVGFSLLLTEVFYWLSWGVIIQLLHAGYGRLLRSSSRVVLKVALAPVALGAVGLLHVGLYYCVMVVLDVGGNNWGVSQFVVFARSYLYYDILVFVGAIGVIVAINHERALREREMHAALLEKQVADARLFALKMQLHPHFLFNTLHSIASLVRKGNNPLAINMIAYLSDLLRYSLESTNESVVPLRRELGYVRLYLQIERERFRDRLTCTYDVEEEAQSALVPTLILQPVVENAVKHGIGSSTGSGEIRIIARREGGWLRVIISNTGGLLRDDWEEASVGRVGLSNVRRRLQEHYKGAYSFVLRREAAGGTSVVIDLPWESEKAS